MEWFDVAVSGIPLLFVVIGLVAYIKKLGVEGKALSVSSMVIGLLFGGGYQVSQIGVPLEFAGWFGIVVYGIGLGLVASGIYDEVKGMLQAK